MGGTAITISSHSSSYGPSQVLNRSSRGDFLLQVQNEIKPKGEENASLSFTLL